MKHTGPLTPSGKTHALRMASWALRDKERTKQRSKDANENLSDTYNLQGTLRVAGGVRHGC